VPDRGDHIASKKSESPLQSVAGAVFASGPGDRDTLNFPTLPSSPAAKES
jgi:hypothetical protein